MKRIVVLLLVVLVASPSFAQSMSKTKKTEVAVVALKIGKEIPGDPEGKLAFHQPGIVLTLVLGRADKLFIGMDGKNSQLVSFTDNKGTDLLKRSGKFSISGLDAFPKFSKDGHVCVFDVRGSMIPAKGATSVRVKAIVVLKYGEGEKTAVQKDLKLKKGSKLTVGPVPWTIEKVGEPDYGNAALGITVTGSVSHATIKKLVFLDADGKEVEHSIGARFSSGARNHMTYNVTYNFKKKVDVVTVKVIYFEKTEIVTIPIDLEVGVGL